MRKSDRCILPQHQHLKLSLLSTFRSNSAIRTVLQTQNEKKQKFRQFERFQRVFRHFFAFKISKLSRFRSMFANILISDILICLQIQSQHLSDLVSSVIASCFVLIERPKKWREHREIYSQEKRRAVNVRAEGIVKDAKFTLSTLSLNFELSIQLVSFILYIKKIEPTYFSSISNETFFRCKFSINVAEVLKQIFLSILIFFPE